MFRARPGSPESSPLAGGAGRAAWPNRRAPARTPARGRLLTPGGRCRTLGPDRRGGAADRRGTLSGWCRRARGARRDVFLPRGGGERRAADRRRGCGAPRNRAPARGRAAVSDQPPADTHDLFLSYHGPDRDAVRTVQQLLEARGIRTFLDRDHLVAGLPWPQALETALRSVRAVAVFLGRAELGTWQKRELWYALERQARAEEGQGAFPVVPVLLPGADPAPGFLFLNTWVDLRRDPADPEALDGLARAVRGEAAARADGRAGLCPYRGLHVFREEDAAFFCGREDVAVPLDE